MRIKSQKLISLFLSILMILSIVPTTVFADYSDINGHWGQTYIQAMADKGSIKGYEDGTFKPDKTISRSEFLAIAIRSCYPDYTPAQAGDTWWAGEYNKAIEKGIISETEMPRSEMDVPIRREEMTMIMVRCAEGKGEKLSDYSLPVVNTLKDYKDTLK
ncbi:MAG: S-layer homology domain-containing protein [Ruminococcaceae bacterium]|nr:S-layer homology domain-containing protein [Oscillospiraceae bacterium]